MNFLVLLISLTINYLWLKDFDRFDDSWFFKFRCQVEKRSAQLQGEQLRWIIALVLIYGLPLVILLTLLIWLEGTLFGLATMALHTLVLLVAFDRTQPGHLAKEFLRRWKEGDEEACVLYLQKELDLSESEMPETTEALSEFFSQQFVYLFFERMFVMFFWYMLTGPLGILIAYITYQLRDSHKLCGGEVNNGAQLEFVSLLLLVLEWLPVRLLALTFSLAGNFVRCFESLSQSFWSFDHSVDTPVLLYGYARCALSGLVEPEEEAKEKAEKKAEENASEDTEGASSSGQAVSYNPSREQKAREISALVSLLERSQAIWLVLLAVMTIFAI